VANSLIRIKLSPFLRLGIERLRRISFVGGNANPGRLMSTSAREIAELNIKHYQNLLKTETDPKKRQTIAMLLAEEESKLATLSAREQERRDTNKSGPASS
jgi:hypothetical protein